MPPDGLLVKSCMHPAELGSYEIKAGSGQEDTGRFADKRLPHATHMDVVGHPETHNPLSRLV
jgi:hypothetical protein